MNNARTYELATIGDRFVAIVIDTIVVGAIGSMVGTNSGWWAGGIVGFIIGATYQWFFLTRYNGQTPGKMLMNIRVVKADGSSITETDAVLRFVGYYVNSIAMGLGWIWALLDSNNQGWHDKLVNTYVVRTSGGERKPKVKNDQLHEAN